MFHNLRNPQDDQSQGMFGGVGNWLGNNSNALIGLGAGIAGGGNLNQAVSQGLQGMLGGRQLDQKQATQMETYRYLLGQGLSPQQAQLVIANPDWMKEYGKAAIAPTMTVGPEGTMVQSGPFGKISSPGGFPVSELKETINRDGSRSPAALVKPSLGNPSGSVIPLGEQSRGQVQPQGSVMQAPGLPGPMGAITAQSPQQIEEQTARGKDLAAVEKTYRDLGIKASQRLPTLDRISQLSDRAYEGKGAEAQLYVRSLLTSFGMKPSPTATATEEVDTLANKLVLDAAGGSLGVGFSNADTTFIKGIQPSSAHTAAGRKEIITTLKMIDKRNQDVSKMAQQWRRTRGTIDGFDDALAVWALENPLFAGREYVDTPTGRAAPAGNAPAVPMASIQHLRNNPQTKNDFIARYGVEAYNQIMSPR